MNNIEEILKKLKEKGIDEGKSEAAVIIAEAEERAKQILADAHKKAAELESAASKRIKEQESAAHAAITTAGKSVVEATVLKITEILDKVLKEKIKSGLNSDETIKKIIAGKPVTAEELIPLLREKTIKDGFDVKYADAKVTVKWKDENYYYEISDEMILNEIKGKIREELHAYIFDAQR